MARRRKPARRRAPSSSTVSTLSTPSTGPVDLVAQAERARLAELLKRMKAGKTLSAGQRRDLAVLQARHMGVESVSCLVGTAGGRPYLVVPSGYSAAVATEGQLAEVYGVDPRTVQRWKAEPGWPSSARGPYLLRDEVSAFVRGKGEAPPPAPPTETDKWTAEVKRERALTFRQERLKAEGRLVEWAKVAERDRKVWGKFKALVQAADRQFAGLATHVCREMDRLETELLSGPFPGAG